MNEVMKNILQRRSCRKYADTQVELEKVKIVLEAAQNAPSGMNFQTWMFTAVRNPKLLKKVNDAVKEAFKRNEQERYRERGYSDSYCCYYDAPTLIIVSNEPTRWWAAMDCACAMENMMLAATSVGLASCWINQPGMVTDEPEIKSVMQEMGIPDNHRIYACLALGYAATDNILKEKVIKEGRIQILD